MFAHHGFQILGRQTEAGANRPHILCAKRLTRLQHGDLVCFDLDDDSRVREIAFSSIWRQGIRTPGASRLATTADLIAQVSQAVHRGA